MRSYQSNSSPTYTESAAITLGMGCFWSPEALFGHVPGVLGTRTGYAGGTTEQPTYHEIGDHSETVEVKFDPKLVTLQQLLELFWKHHKPVNINGYKGRQYWSLALYRDQEQREAIEWVKRRLEEESGGPLDTEVSPCPEFYPAESRHQKYYLKRFPDAVAKLGELYGTEENWVDTTLAARLNGLAKGYTSMERITDEMRRWPIHNDDRERILKGIRRIRW
ncbi:peptide-methionine (S)-S-oxide reductase MsrA [Paenibacillus xylaniclasticus]|uniref:peptide-methionine (S)-S-oxide reductase MsrA n=1 Tax=Paenibacillus xylaniclasticus TaxID=588083 RepID=UPI000FD82800|nr:MULTISPECIES: peptide-methionine (S)-S-oxide reductase MsrA [Paenibacillus]GFN31491.1 methionine-S-sulfoxide reductase [Paenibacillus curdlanolyticus]